MALAREEQLQARKKAMALLEHMSRTEKGLRERLLRCGFSPEATEDAMDYVKSFGYINDKSYARLYISNRMTLKSRQKILQELMQKGIDRRTAMEAWEEEAELNVPDERAVIRREIEKKHTPGTTLTEKEMRRLYGYLARRGFHSGDIFSVLEDLDIKQEQPFWD